jgi:hypothetical protein
MCVPIKSDEQLLERFNLNLENGVEHIDAKRKLSAITQSINHDHRLSQSHVNDTKNEICTRMDRLAHWDNLSVNHNICWSYFT